MNRIVVIPILLIMVACSNKQVIENKITPECANYQGMMTAPIAPDAMNRLKLACNRTKN